jgi:hypothetical protein
VWFGRFINFLAFSSTVIIILIARNINVRKWRTLAQTMDLLAGMQCAFICGMSVLLHVAWGGVKTGRDNNAFIVSTIGTLVLLQVAGTFCPDGCSLKQSCGATTQRDRGVMGRRTSNSSVTSEDNYPAPSDDESAHDTIDLRAAAGLRSAVAPPAARFSGRMAPMRWAIAIRAAGAVVLALMDPILVPIPATVRKPWLSGVWTAWIQICVLVVHVKSTQVLLTLYC